MTAGATWAIPRAAGAPIAGGTNRATAAPARYAKYDVREGKIDTALAGAVSDDATRSVNRRSAPSADGAPPTTAPGCRRAVLRCPTRGDDACGAVARAWPGATPSRSAAPR